MVEVCWWCVFSSSSLLMPTKYLESPSLTTGAFFCPWNMSCSGNTKMILIKTCPIIAIAKLHQKMCVPKLGLLSILPIFQNSIFDLYFNGINIFILWNSYGVFRDIHAIHILFVIGALCTYQSNFSINEIEHKKDSLYKVH